ncbi:MAG: hemolysin III family protein [Marivibrio sp.]|uniref:PAQR family membrane homeostasis protein TrhA n=1 Tax=Marivibrio sp. TaxID=2039719 RepID=UPI0032EAB6ED
MRPFDLRSPPPGTPDYSRAEARVDGAVQALGFAAAPPAAVILGLVADGTTATLGSVIYGLSLTAMTACSALYHWVQDPSRKALCRRADRAALFALIAGTYTALLTGSLGDALGPTWRALALGFIWAAAGAASYLEIRHPRRFERTTLALALLLGWCGLMLLNPMLESLSPAVLALIGGGGVAYSAGVGFHLWRTLPFHNAVWHGFVLSGVICHYIAVFLTHTS